MPRCERRLGRCEAALATPHILIRWEFPRLCRGGRRSLTNPGMFFHVCFGISDRFEIIAFEPRNIEQGISNIEVKTAVTSIFDIPCSIFDIYFLFFPGPFEGPEIIKPPALPVDTY